MEKTCARILLLGKTGVGKSSFINYFLGRDIAKTGIGRPVTQELKEYETEHNGIYLNVTDSKGLEVENSEQIKKDIIDNIVARNGKDDIFEWYHTIFYCISVTNARIEKYELEFLKELKQKISQNIHIILTNCDNPEKAQEQIKGMKEKLNKELGMNVHIYEVCSVEITKRGGKKILPHGRDNILKGVFDLLWDDICRKVAEDFTKKIVRPQLERFLIKKKDEIDKLIDENVRLLKISKALKDDVDVEALLNKVMEDYSQEFDDKVAGLGKQLNERLKEVREFYSAYYDVILEGDYIADNIAFDFSLELIDIEDIIEDTELKKLMDMFEYEELRVKNIIKGIKGIFQINKLVHEIFDKIYNYIVEKIKTYEFEEKIYDEISSIRVPK